MLKHEVRAELHSLSRTDGEMKHLTISGYCVTKLRRGPVTW